MLDLIHLLLSSAARTGFSCGNPGAGCWARTRCGPLFAGLSVAVLQRFHFERLGQDSVFVELCKSEGVQGILGAVTVHQRGRINSKPK